MLAKDPELGQSVKDIFDMYREFGFVGIKNEDTDLAELNPAPPPEHPERHLWEPSDPELGPIGLVLSTVFKMGAALDIDTLTIHQHGEVNTKILEVPYNHLRKALSNPSVRAKSLQRKGRGHLTRN